MKTGWKKKLAKNWCIAGAGMLGVLLFVAVYGTAIWNPCYDAWLLKGGDSSQHYLGWLGFRSSGWHFPFGLFDTIMYPNRTSVIFTDSIPLLALLFKVLSPFLPDTFQYMGFWGALCFGLSGVFSAAILKKILNSNWMAMLGSVFFILSPTMLKRLYGHEALAGHWVLLLAFFLFYYWDSDCIRKHVLLWCMLVGGLSVSIHLYFLPMCGMILAGCLLQEYGKSKNVVRLMKILSAFLLGAGGVIYLLGGFQSYGSAAGAEGLGAFSFNLNAFWNPMGQNRLGISYPLSCQEQYEGYAYLGAGILALIFLHACCALYQGGKALLRGEKPGIFLKDNIPVWSIACLSLVAATSQIVTYGSSRLFAYPLPVIIVKAWGVFRSTGRLIWPMYYLLMFYPELFMAI